MDHVWDTLARYEREWTQALEKRSMSAWTEAEMAEYNRITRQGEYAAAERQELTARDKAEINQLIDEQREQEQAADEAYWEYQAELEDERRNDR